jgi:hypothetical protein
MKAKSFLKRNLTPVICAAMLFTPVLPACYAADGADVTENSVTEAAHTVQLNITEEGEPYSGLQFDLYAYVKDKTTKDTLVINCGSYDTGENSSINVEIPEIILNRFSDESRYTIEFRTKATNTSAECFFGDTDIFTYKGESDENYNMDIELSSYSEFIGSLQLTPPEKLVYKIGEELDLTGGRTLGAGIIINSKLNAQGMWDDFGSKLGMNRVDSCDFDNSKPGTYVIKYTNSKSSNQNNNIKATPDEFTVTVVDSERPEGATAKISIVDDVTGKSLKGVKVTLFEDSDHNEEIDPDTDRIIAMWNTSKNPERLFTETEFDPDKRYYLGFENIPDEYDGSLIMYCYGYDFVSEDFFSFTKEDDNTDWTVRVDSDKPIFETENKIKFRFYSRFKGRLNRFKNVGFTEIKDSDGNIVGTYPINRAFALPDGDYSSTIYVCSKDYDCFSNKNVDFTVTDGRSDKFLDYEIEKRNFGKLGNGDSNMDGTVDMSDIVLIMQSQSNPDKYGVNGSEPSHITDEGCHCADIDENGVTNLDAVNIQKYLLGYYDI